MNALRLALLAPLLLATEVLAQEALPGRVLQVSLGGNLHGSYGRATRAPPDLLRVAPELQLAWGMQLGGQILLLTRFDLLGGMLPLLPTGLGLDLSAGWAPWLGGGGVTPLLRGSAGGFLFHSGGELPGPDYQAYGFRLALEAGFLAPIRGVRGRFFWGATIGANAVGLPSVGPCSAGDDCSDALLGPSLRGEALWLF